MRFDAGTKPQWKSKPKMSTLDTDPDFMKLKAKILSNTMKPFEQAGLYVDESDNTRLQTKNAARLVRDYVRRMLKSVNLEADFVITCRQTAEPGVWGVWVTYEPRESAVGGRRAYASSEDGRRNHEDQ